MPRKYQLTWDKHSKRWKKYYRGRQYYFPFGKAKTDHDGYQDALDAWRQKKDEIDGELRSPQREAWAAWIGILRNRQEEVQAGGNNTKSRTEWDFLECEIAAAKQAAKEGSEFPPSSASSVFTGDEDLARFLGLAIRWRISARRRLTSIDPAYNLGKVPELPILKSEGKSFSNDNSGIPSPWDQVADSPDDETVAGNIARFLERKRQQAERGECSKGRYDVLRVHLEDFASHIGPNKPLEAITSAALDEYRERLQKQIDAGKYSAHYAKSRLSAVKQFIKWMWEQELIDLPRIVNSRDFSIVVPSSKIDVFSLEEIKTLLDASPDRMWLYIFLMLNCGMTQGDIAQLKHTEIDWEKGQIVRKRSKTKNQKSVPVVSYLLWPETFRLLVKYKSNHPTLALTNRNGGALKTESIVEGKYTKIDNIATAWNRLTKKVGIKKPLKLLRKTAASKLAEHSDYSRFVQFFLGHAPGNVADRHYVKPPQAAFDDAIKWLGEQFTGESK